MFGLVYSRCPPPAAPFLGSVVYTPNPAGPVNVLTFSGVDSNAIVLNIYRRSASGLWVLLEAIDPLALSYDDRTALPNIAYTYVVRVIANGLESAASNAVVSTYHEDVYDGALAATVYSLVGKTKVEFFLWGKGANGTAAGGGGGGGYEYQTVTNPTPTAVTLQSGAVNATIIDNTAGAVISMAVAVAAGGTGGVASAGTSGIHFNGGAGHPSSGGGGGGVASYLAAGNNGAAGPDGAGGLNGNGDDSGGAGNAAGIGSNGLAPGGGGGSGDTNGHSGVGGASRILIRWQ